jgi:hypothetical protein
MMSRAVTRVRERGALLVFPINNREDPKSLWSEFFPKTEMVWDWNEDGDARVAGMWQLMKRLSGSGDVVYSKWYQGRDILFAGAVYRHAGLAAPEFRSTPWDLTRRKNLDRDSRE